MNRLITEAQLNISVGELKASIDDLLKDVKIDTKHDVPYTAGYSVNDKTVYIDHEVPKFMTTKEGRKVDVWRFLVVHEIIEKSMLMTHKLDYPHAHQIALRMEQATVEDEDRVSWNEYNTWMMKVVDDVQNRKEWPNVPKDLDMTPYKDLNDKTTMRNMHVKEGAMGLTLIKRLNESTKPIF